MKHTSSPISLSINAMNAFKLLLPMPNRALSRSFKVAFAINASRSSSVLFVDCPNSVLSFDIVSFRSETLALA